MLKTQNPPLHQLQKQYTNSLNTDGSSSVLSSNIKDLVNFITFNQDASCVALGLNNGYKIFNCQPNFGKSFQFKKHESIGIVEMLYCTSLVALVGQGEEIGSSPRKLRIINTKKQSTICELIFPSTILEVKLTRTRLVVVLEDQIYIYDISTMKLLHTIETSPNLHGLVAISYDPENSFLAYPSPPKTITHDSLLASGINTNGGLNSSQNNITSVSKTPNRVGDVIIFNLTTLQPISVIEAHKSNLAAIAFSNQGDLLATASDKGTIIRIFEISTGIKLYQFRRGTYPTKIYSLRFSVDDNYIVATSSSLTVHIFRLGEEEALANKQQKKKKKLNIDVIVEEDESKPKSSRKNSRSNDEEFDIRDDGDDSDELVDDDEEDDEEEDEDNNIVKQRKLSQGSVTSSIHSEDIPISNSPKSEPLIDQNRISVARLIRRSSQTLGRKAAQKMGDFLPLRFSSILEPTRNFASLKINAINKDTKSIAVMSNIIQPDLVPSTYVYKDNDSKSTHSTISVNSKDVIEVNFLHIYVVTSEGMFYIYGVDPERGGDCILLQQYSLLEESALISIKNAGKVYEINVEPSDTGSIFKQKIQQLTLIPPERQKILIKGGKLSDDVLISSVVDLFKSGPIMVLGTPDKHLPSKPVEKQVFIEDLNKNQLVKVSNDPSGLVNLGNTCYLNSTLQALFQIDDITSRLKEYRPQQTQQQVNDGLVLSLKNVFQQMSAKQESINPTLFLALFRNLFPQFAEQQHGIYKQQDAEEAFSQILGTLRQSIKVDDLFNISFKTTSKCLALPEEDVVQAHEESFKLNCHIDIKTNFLRDGILAGLKETIEKYNETLQANTDYEITKTIDRLPKYLTVHFMRFFWRRDINKKSKILRRVQFPFELDLAEMLDESIKQEKVAIRDKIRKIEKDNLDLIRDFKKSKKDTDLNPLEQEQEDELKIESIKSKFKDDLVSTLPENINIDTTKENISSVYILNAVITHTGASADGGHYKAYVKDPNDLDGDRWWLFNDDKVSSVSREKIETLAGGGESDAALLLIYKGLGL
ncbi:Autophagy-related protein 18 [Spathaspora sp. JA1]|nr:Autophagy-related protein 18 [Spathaspora sp. JA1]